MLDHSKMSVLRGPALLLGLLALGVGCTSSPTPTPLDAASDVVAEAGMDAPEAPPARCTSNAMCAGQLGRPVCDTASGSCVSCASNAALCPATEYCNPATGACVAGCSRDEGCAAAGGDGGVDGGGATGRCDTVTHMCVQCVTDDHCPAGSLCRGSTCAAGCGPTRACPTGQSCCDGACIDTQSNVAACGACGTTCRVANGAPSCAMGRCGIRACTAPYSDCDMSAANGCEVSLQADPMNCGACGAACPAGTNAVGACVMGACRLECASGFADCDGMAANGCEVDKRADTANCGACGRACAIRNATAACRTSACAIDTCNAGFGDCDADPATGCETSTATSAQHCGACDRACNLANVLVNGCAAGACTIVTCDPGFADCDMNPANGCEVNTDTSNTSCGACGRSCGMGMCARGVCTSVCGGGRGDCDGNVANGCESDLTTDTLNCGACRASCVAGPQATPRCAAGRCSITCAAGFADCDATPDDGCEIDTRVSQNHCGACGRPCPTGQVCNDSVCVTPCPGAQTRCSGACVSLTSDNANCGACGNACAADSTCTDGVCRCAIGSEPLAGVRCGAACVDVLTSATSCGTCGNACPTGSTCTRGVCRCAIAGIPIGVLCGATCADPFNDRNNCGRCGNACPTGQSCVTGTCRCVTAAGGMGSSCGGVCSDTSADRNNCGGCGNACPASQICEGGMCRACAAGTTFCAGVCTNTASDARNCGGCGTVCPAGQVCFTSMCTASPPVRYRVITNPSGVTFTDACALPGVLRFVGGADDAGALSPIPFGFRYWNRDFPAGTNANVCSNGWVGLGFTTTDGTINTSIPDPGTPNAFMALHMRDLYAPAGGICVAVSGTAPSRRWVASWTHGTNYPSNTGDLNFSFTLHEGTNFIDIAYGVMTGGSAATTGAENVEGTIAISHCADGAFSCLPAAASAYRYEPIP